MQRNVVGYGYNETVLVRHNVLSTLLCKVIQVWYYYRIKDLIIQVFIDTYIHKLICGEIPANWRITQFSLLLFHAGRYLDDTE
jgi:hypothetical protein